MITPVAIFILTHLHLSSNNIVLTNLIFSIICNTHYLPTYLRLGLFDIRPSAGRPLH